METEREKAIALVRSMVKAHKIEPAELYFDMPLEKLGLTAGDFLKLRCTAEAMQQTYENALAVIICSPDLKVTEMVREHVGSVLGRINYVNEWAQASREFFEAYGECCHKCKQKKKVEAARDALHPVVREGR